MTSSFLDAMHSLRDLQVLRLMIFVPTSVDKAVLEAGQVPRPYITMLELVTAMTAMNPPHPIVDRRPNDHLVDHSNILSNRGPDLQALLTGLVFLSQQNEHIPDEIGQRRYFLRFADLSFTVQGERVNGSSEI